MVNEGTKSPEALALLLLTRQFALLLNAGTTLSDSLHILSREAQPPYGDVMTRLEAHVAHNKALHQAMRREAQYFPPFYVTMVLAGELGGILDETLLYLADLLEDAWKYAHLTGTAQGAIGVWSLDSPSPAQDWAMLSDEQCAFSLMLFCRTFGLLLSSGVPILQSMEITTEFLPAVQRDAWLTMREQIQNGARLTAATFLPPFVLQLVGIGEETGSLHHQMQKAADYYQHVLEAKSWQRHRER